MACSGVTCVGQNVRMNQQRLPEELERWVVEQALSGADPDAVLKPLLDAGWDEQAAIDAIQGAVSRFMEDNARDTGLPLPRPVPVPIAPNGAAVLDLGDRQVQVLASLMLPRVVVLGGFLSDEECDGLIQLATPALRRSTTVNERDGGNQVHADRTSRGMFLERGADPLSARIEARIARLAGWPTENGERLQVLHYTAGAEYKPHYDYFDPDSAGTEVILQRGGQRVATLVMYLNTPELGGATTFPDVHLEVAAVKGNAVFFSYDRPHPMTRTLHGGAPVRAGEKWVATKWLRERRHD